MVHPSPDETSYRCILGLMGSASHLANEKGNEDRDHSTTDGRIVYYRTPYARMIDIDLGPFGIDFGSIRVV